MHRIRFLFLGLLAAFGLLAGCQTAASKILSLTEADHGRAVRAKKGESIQIVLEGNPTTGYTWLVDDLDTKVVEATGAPTFTPSSNAVGAGGWFTFNFVAEARGQTNMRVIYVRASERFRSPEKTFAIMITVD